MNHQLLLNLARLSHGEPAYFIQLGTISSQYSFSSSDTFSPTRTRNTSPSGVSGAITRTIAGNIGAGMTSTPTFNYTPLNGAAFASAITAPISDTLFYTLYDQGFSADTLIRTMVASVSITTKTPVDGVDKPVETKETTLVNEPFDPSYAGFLVLCNQMRTAQLHHNVLVTHSFQPDDSTNKQLQASYAITDLKAGDEVTAANAGFNVISSTDQDKKTTYALQPVMKKTYALTLSGIHDDKLTEVNRVFGPNCTLHFKMRTFEAAMYSVAKEEGYFGELLHRQESSPESKWAEVLPYANVTFGTNANGLIAIVTPDPKSPDVYFKVRPILTLTTYDKDQRSHLYKIVEISYKGTVYTVGDPEGTAMGAGELLDNDPQAPSPSNGTVFTLLSYLFTQVAIDPQKLPVQQFIQVQ
jgi:hypothetical protein